MTEETVPFVTQEHDRAAASPPDPFPGEFRVLRYLGGGAFGEVWLAEDMGLGRPVALKFLRLSGNAAKQVQALAILRNDARLLAALRHPNIVQIHAWRQPSGPAGSEPFLVLQYVPGGSLEDRVQQEGTLPWAVATRYIADVAEGLLSVHGRGIVHRDVKPGNILWDPETDEALLTDFGIGARLADQGSAGGTLRYMAPEAFDGVNTPALDVYGLAASLFFLVTGQPPFLALNMLELRREIERGLSTLDPRCAGLPAAVERLIRAGLTARAEYRPALVEFARSLRGTLNLLLADTLPQRPDTSKPGAPVNLRLIVSRQVDRSTVVPVATSHVAPETATGRVLRDFKRVPPPPERVTLHTGDRVRLEVEADQPGYVTVFNVGPSGNLNLLYPPDLTPGTPPPLLPAHQALPILDVELTPPEGQERLFALWTRVPLPLRTEELLSIAQEGKTPLPGPYRATRDMVRVQQSMQQLRAEDRHVVVLELDHR
jgi:serine/threonine protein kinase